MKLRVMAEMVSDPGNGTYVDYTTRRRVLMSKLGRDLGVVPLIFHYAKVSRNCIDVTLNESLIDERVSRSRNTVVNILPESRRQITLSYPGDFVKARVGDIRYIFEAIR